MAQTPRDLSIRPQGAVDMFRGGTTMYGAGDDPYLQRHEKTTPTIHRRLRALLLVLAIALVAAACGSDDSATFDGVAEGSASIVNEADIGFAEIAPFATFGSGQGDFTSGPHGTFGIFGAGASSPAHTHSSQYYAVVLSSDTPGPTAR